MPTVNAAYEAVLLFSVANGDEAAVALKDKFAELIAQNAQAGDIDDWGKRKLAYLFCTTSTARPTSPLSLSVSPRSPTVSCA